nr:uncharacterized protein LOC109161635 isoform X1 [Ipomoea batatas]
MLQNRPHQLPESITPNQTPSSAHHNKLIYVNHAHAGFQSFTKLSFNSSPTVSLPLSGNGFRRAQSSSSADEFSLAVPLRKFARKPRGSFLETHCVFLTDKFKKSRENEESDEYEEADEEWKAFNLNC